MTVAARTKALSSLLALAAAAWLPGCAADDATGVASDDVVAADEDVSSSADALTGDRDAGTKLVTTENLNLREGSSTGTAILLTMPKGSAVAVVSAAPKNGFYNVKYGSRTGWAHGGYLRMPSSSGGGGGDVRIVGPGVRAHVQGFANSACGAVGCPYEVGTRNGHEPTADRALDFMMSKLGAVAGGGDRSRGESLALRAIDDRDHKVLYAIWRQRINTLDGRGWRAMEDRGGATQNHFDHVHVSFKP